MPAATSAPPPAVTARTPSRSMTASPSRRPTIMVVCRQTSPMPTMPGAAPCSASRSEDQLAVTSSGNMAAAHMRPSTTTAPAVSRRARAPDRPGRGPAGPGEPAGPSPDAVSGRSSESGPLIVHGTAAAETTVSTRRTPAMCSPMGTPAPAMACPMTAPSTAPRLQAAWKLVMMLDPQRRSTRRACAFWATSIMASVPPTQAMHSARTSQEPAAPAPSSPRPSTIIPTEATRAEVKRVMHQEAVSPAASAPTEENMTAWPKAALVMPRCASNSG